MKFRVMHFRRTCKTLVIVCAISSGIFPLDRSRGDPLLPNGVESLTPPSNAPVATFIDSAGKDLRRFLDELECEELIHISAEPRQGGLFIAPEFANSGDYAVPNFEKFTDMADMFALDPPLPGIARQADQQE